MAKLTSDSLMTLESYSRVRNDFRAEVMEHKKKRKVMLGEHLTLLFEDEMTMRYQVQEMLRAEKIFEADGIRDELDAYNPLIPDGSNWKATMMIEYADIEERRRMLAQLLGIENGVWIQVQGSARVYAIADEDLERATEDKTSAVHFLRFELTPDMIAALKRGAALNMGVDHPAYQAEQIPVADEVRAALVEDLHG